MALHVVSKQNNAETATFPLDTPFPSLSASSIRVKTSLLAITSNNLSYARNGTLLHWWSCYPVPDTAPAPYNDNEKWGIVPAWGYGDVVESNIPALPVGTQLYGFWPTSSYPVDLNVEPSSVTCTGQWTEISEHRSKCMTVYNRYLEAKKTLSDQDRALIAGVQAVWQCGYLINSRVFPDTSSVKPAHPLGLPGGWTEEDADLSSAVVISLSAASKTARSLAWNLARNRDVASKGPLGLVQATSTISALASFQENSVLKIKNVAYSDLLSSDTMNWIADLNPTRMVIIDFGAAQSVLLSLIEALSTVRPESAVTTIAVGSESKVYSAEELKTVAANREKLKKIQINTSGLRDRSIEDRDAAQWFKDMNAAWERCIREGGMGKIEVLWREGVRGENGIDGMWQDVCNGRARGDQCMVVKVQGV